MRNDFIEGLYSLYLKSVKKDSSKQSLLIEAMYQEYLDNQNPAMDLFYLITKCLRCECNENECEEFGAFESCFACQKISDLIAKLDNGRWIK
jgi:hypothetical protein